MEQQTSATLKDEFRNTTKGFIGVVTINPNGKERGVAVRPGQNIWLSEEEQILTANAPRRDDDNPFTNGNLKLVTKAQDVKNRRPIGDAAEKAEGPAPAEEVAPPPEGAEAAEPPRVERQGAEANQAPKPEAPAPSERAAKETARREAAAKRQAAADKQAQAGAVPAEAQPSDIAPSGQPKPAQGTRPAAEETGTPTPEPAKA